MSPSFRRGASGTWASQAQLRRPGRSPRLVIESTGRVGLVCSGSGRLHRAGAVDGHRPDRSALCDFFDSQSEITPPDRVRGAPAQQEGSGALGGRVLAGFYFLGTPDTRHKADAGADGRPGLCARRASPRRGRGAGAVREAS